MEPDEVADADAEQWRQSPEAALTKGKALQKEEEWEDAADAFGVALELRF